MSAGRIITVVWIALVSTAAPGSEGRPVGDTYAIIVNGIGKDPQDGLLREQVVSGLRAYLQEKAAVKPERLAVLSSRTAMAEKIKSTIDAFAAAGTSADRFIFYYIGQANVVGDSLRLNLPGPDVTQGELSQWMAAVKATTQLVVLDCPYAAAAAKTLARPGRVAIFATAQEQAYAPRFGVHFVPALTREDSDTNHDGGVSVLEAFTAAAREIEEWYQKMQLLPTETPCLDDNGDGRPGARPWRYEQDGGDGRPAAGLILTSRVLP
jgi:hypothetical protein